MSSRFCAIIACSLLGTSVVSLIGFHRTLSGRVIHSFNRQPISTNDFTTESIPDDVHKDAARFDIIHDRATKTIPSHRLPTYNDPDQLLSVYLRRNMCYFARFPQSFLLQFAIKDQALMHTFRMQHIQRLTFVRGDIVCGIYRVELRTPDKVEFAIILPGDRPPIAGRLTISIEKRGSDSVFISEAVQWKKSDQPGKLPLDNPTLRWLHELSSWWLLDSGTKSLVEANVM